MGDNETTEMWREYGRTRQAKRAKNREDAAQILSLNNIKFESKNDGAHLIVEFGLGKIDFWPGTGLFIPRSTGKRERGIDNLVKLCVQTAQPQELVGIDLAKGPDSTVIHADLAETEARLAAHIEEVSSNDQNTTRAYPDHAYKPDERTVDDDSDTSDPPWD